MKDILKWDQIPNGYQSLLLDTARQVEGFLCITGSEKRFKAAIDWFMGLLVANYAKPSSHQNPNPLQWFLSPQTNLVDKLLAANRIDGSKVELQQREPMPDELPMLYCVKLMVIHDLLAKTLNMSERYFTADEISNQTDYGIVAQDIWDKVMDSKSYDVEENRIKIALDTVQLYLAKLKTTETGQDNKIPKGAELVFLTGEYPEWLPQEIIDKYEGPLPERVESILKQISRGFRPHFNGKSEIDPKNRQHANIWRNGLYVEAGKIKAKRPDLKDPPDPSGDPFSDVNRLYVWAVNVKEILLSTNDKKTDSTSTKPKNEQTISQLITRGEGPAIEFKETLEYSVQESKHDTNLNKECLKTIAAFLNTDGGTLLIGVRDNGEITGIERDLPYVQKKNEDGFQLKLRDLIKSNFTPFPSGKVHISFEKFTKETVCRVDVDPVNKNQTIHLGKDVYIRDGNTKRKLEGPDLTYWVQQRGK